MTTSKSFCNSVRSVWISLAVVAGIWPTDMVRADIVDEAKALGKTPEDFPAASYDYFRAMDMVPAMEAGADGEPKAVVDTSGNTVLKPLDLTADETKGRNTWMMW